MSEEINRNMNTFNIPTFIDRIVSSLTTEEKLYYDESLEMSNLFQYTDNSKANILTNTSALYNTSLNLSRKYTSPPIMKTYYSYPKNSNEEYKTVIDCINWNQSEELRPKLITIKNILICRKYKQSPFVNEVVNYDKYAILSESSLVCPNCKSHKITIENKQKRAADEPSETFYKCQDCNKEFKEHFKFST